MASRQLRTWVLGWLLTVGIVGGVCAGEGLTLTVQPAGSLPGIVPPFADERPLAISLPAALQLANAGALDVAAAAHRVRAASAALDQAKVLWLPTLTLGADYSRHDGRIQDVGGTVFTTSRSSLMFGAGSGIGSAAILNINDALFTPLVARQQVQAREAELQVAANDTLLSVSEAYFNIQQARGELAGAADAVRRTEELTRRTRKLAPALVPELEALRAEAELARRQQAELLVRQRWSVASAELLRLLRLDPAAQVEPVEPPHLRVELIDVSRPVDDLITVGLMNRPELASNRSQVAATLTLLRQEKLRPLVPSLLLRGWSTPVTGTFAAGVFTGGKNSSLTHTGLRGDIDVQVLWQFDNLGLGNQGRIRQRQAENQLAMVELFRTQDRVAGEVARAHAEAKIAAQRIGFAEAGVRVARESVEKNLTALSQTKGSGNQMTLLIRPQEAVASVQSLALAYSDYYAAIGDANRAQFRLYRALGKPAACLIPPAAEPEPQAASFPTPELLPAIKAAPEDTNPLSPVSLSGAK